MCLGIEASIPILLAGDGDCVRLGQACQEGGPKE